jgi:hypothetical protein
MKYHKTELNGFELIKNLLICTKDQISEYMRNRDIIHVIFTSWLSYNNNNIEP